MKRFITYLSIALAALAMISCSDAKRKQALLPNISGKAGEVIVVIDKGHWEGTVGTAIRDSLACDCPYLPQREPLYTLVNVAPSGFGQMFQIHRNILIVNISPDVTEPGIIYKTDVWARPQCVIRINAADSETAVQLVKDNSERLRTTLEQAERDRVIANAKKYEERSLAPVVANVAGGSPHFPSGYQLKKKTEDFVWIEYNPQFVTQGVLIFKYPVVEGEDMMNLDNIIKNCNTMLKNNVPGMFDNTFMTFSSFARPSIEYIKYKGREFAEIRGFWEVQNDYMGGPFAAHAFYSPDGKEMIVLMGFVYAPKYDKRQYLRQVESIIYSFDWTNVQ